MAPLVDVAAARKRDEGTADDSCCPLSEIAGREMKVALLRKGMDGNEFAAQVGWKVDRLRRRLNGATEMTLGEFVVLAEALGIDPSALLRVALGRWRADDPTSGPPAPRRRIVDTAAGDTEIF